MDPIKPAVLALTILALAPTAQAIAPASSADWTRRVAAYDERRVPLRCSLSDVHAYWRGHALIQWNDDPQAIYWTRSKTGVSLVEYDRRKKKFISYTSLKIRVAAWCERP